MRKAHYLFFFTFILSVGYAQSDSLLIRQNQYQIDLFKNRVNYLNNQLSLQGRDFKSLQNQVAAMKANADSLSLNLDAAILGLEEDMESFQEVQAQTERALNLALDDFRNKFEEQNRNAAKMQATLEAKVNQEIMIAAAIGLILIALFILFNRISFKRGTRQNLASWNQFQDYFLNNQSR